MLAVREDLAEHLSGIAARKGYSLYSIVNEALSAFIAVEDSGLMTGEVLQAHRILATARDIGFVMSPESLWYEAVDLAYQKDGELLSERWFEAGAHCAKLYLVRGGDDPLSGFVRDICNLAWNGKGLNFERAKDEEQILVRCMGRRLSKAYTSLLSLYLEGAFTAFGYRCVQKDVATGAMQLRFVPKAAAPALEAGIPVKYWDRSSP